ncbi:MAG: hypothetical protein KAT46_07505, partial [Deltaproteobacteria bacterium]|nr:hypothetical protein [Deltaproteobacteria bacterium]
PEPEPTKPEPEPEEIIEEIEAGELIEDAESEADEDILKVLMVDGNNEAIKKAKKALKPVEEIRLTAVNTGEEALKLLSMGKYDLLVTELHLKEPHDPASRLDGEDLLKFAHRAQKDLPSILITGKVMVDKLSLDPKWYSLNVKGFIQKANPFWSDELKDKTKETLLIID